MVRIDLPSVCVVSGFPHARGDGPNKRDNCNRLAWFSPRPWGWSDWSECSYSCLCVFPTPVGMVRRNNRPRETRDGFPHARGDGPRGGVVIVWNRLFSPRPWGWSAMPKITAEIKKVFPTPVGMVRYACFGASAAICFPHARGDGPRNSVLRGYGEWFSPRPWGWSATSTGITDIYVVFPTPVGMVR